MWKTKDESGNLKQLHYEDMISCQKYSEVEMELRKIVDEMMRHELDLLQVGFSKFIRNLYSSLRLNSESC